MQIIKSMTLDVSGQSGLERVYAKQGDVRGRTILLTLASGGTVLRPKEGEAAVLRCVKPDGHSTLTACTVQGDGTILAVLPEQALAVPGLVLADVSLSDAEGKVVSTVNFSIEVEKAPISDNTAPSEDDLSFFRDTVRLTLANVSAAEASAYRAREAMEQAEESRQAAVQSSLSAMAASASAENAAGDIRSRISELTTRMEHIDKTQKEASVIVEDAQNSARTTANLANAAAASATAAERAANEMGGFVSAAESHERAAAASAAAAANASAAAIQAAAGISAIAETGVDPTLSVPGVGADAKAAGDAIAEVAQDLMQLARGKLTPDGLINNMINTACITYGKYLDGEGNILEIDNTDVGISRKINVRGIRNIYEVNMGIISFYDSGDRYISSLPTTSSGSQPVPANAEYMIATVWRTFLDTAAIYAGIAELPYDKGYFDVAEELGTAITFKEEVEVYNYRQKLPNADKAAPNSEYILSFEYGNPNITANLPWKVYSFYYQSCLITIGSGAYRFQLLVGDSVYFRISGHAGKDWFAWRAIEPADYGSMLRNLDVVDPSNYQVLLPDVNALQSNTCVMLSFVKGESNIPANLPWSAWREDSTSVILTLASGDYKWQFLMGSRCYTRVSGNGGKTWWAWIEAGQRDDNKKVVTVGTGMDYTSLTLAVKENPANTIFRLSGETFDLEAEYKQIYGKGFFANYVHYAGVSDAMFRGLSLGNGCELIGTAKTTLDFPYSGGNENVHGCFSLVATTQNNVVSNIRFRMHGNCRYAIHDDFAVQAGQTVIENCVFEGDTSHIGRPAIGGGMGTDNTYIIRNCAFLSANVRSIGFHNGEAAACRNRLTIEDCFCRGDIVIFHYGAAAEKTPVLIHGCAARSIQLEHADPANYPNENIDLITWNNETGAM